MANWVGYSVTAAITAERVLRWIDDARKRYLFRAAAAVRTTARKSIETDDTGPSEPGQPPHTHASRSARWRKRGKGRSKGMGRAKPGNVLRNAILFAVDEFEGEAVIGPAASIAADSGKAHEFGGEFRGTNFPQRRFMGPALERIEPKMMDIWRQSISH